MWLTSWKCWRYLLTKRPLHLCFDPPFQPPLRVLRPLTRSRSALSSNNEAMWNKSSRHFLLPLLQQVNTLNGQTPYDRSSLALDLGITKVTYDDPLYSYSLWLLIYKRGLWHWNANEWMGSMLVLTFSVCGLLNVYLCTAHTSSFGLFLYVRW